MYYDQNSGTVHGPYTAGYAGPMAFGNYGNYGAGTATAAASSALPTPGMTAYQSGSSGGSTRSGAAPGSGWQPGRPGQTAVAKSPAQFQREMRQASQARGALREGDPGVTVIQPGGGSAYTYVDGSMAQSGMVTALVDAAAGVTGTNSESSWVPWILGGAAVVTGLAAVGGGIYYFTRKRGSTRRTS